MAHRITRDDTVLTTQGKGAWHHLETRIPGECTIQEALQLAHLDWEVELQDLVTAKGTQVPDSRAVVRLDTGKVLGVVGGRWRPIQNAEQAAFLEALLDNTDAIVETAGSVKGGGTVWFQVRIPKEIKIGGTDEVKPYMLVANGHDGRLGFHALNTNVRVVCDNTVNAAIVGAKAKWTIWHTEGIKGRIQEARDALQISLAYHETWEALMNRLAQTSCSDGDWGQIVDQLWPIPTGEKVTARAKEAALVIQSDVHAVYGYSPTVPRGNLWGAWNAITEYVDHHGGRQGRGDEDKLRSLWWGKGADFKGTALATLTRRLDGRQN